MYMYKIPLITITTVTITIIIITTTTTTDIATLLKGIGSCLLINNIVQRENVQFGMC